MGLTRSIFFLLVLLNRIYKLYFTAFQCSQEVFLSTNSPCVLKQGITPINGDMLSCWFDRKVKNGTEIPGNPPEKKGAKGLTVNCAG